MELFFSSAELPTVLNMCVNADANYLTSMHDELEKSDYDTWTVPGVKAVLQIAYEIYLCVLHPYLAELGELGEDFFPINSQLNFFSFSDTANLKVFEDDDALIDKAIDQRVFKFISTSIIGNDKFHSEVSWQGFFVFIIFICVCSPHFCVLLSSYFWLIHGDIFNLK